MEYLEGKTLSYRLKKGRLPLEQALRYATEARMTQRIESRFSIPCASRLTF